jgi:branched-chain amino acid transport system substrate-binding protein
VAKVGVERVVGTRFNVENRIDQTGSDRVDTELYAAAMAHYAPDTSARSAATVAFRGAMNLWAVLDEAGAGVTPGDVIRILRDPEGRASFDGHDYTCDGSPLPDLPSLCSPQQVVAELVGPDEFVESSDGWVDVPAVVARSARGR